MALKKGLTLKILIQHTHACMNTHMQQLQKDEFWKMVGLPFSKMDSERVEFQFGFEGV